MVAWFNQNVGFVSAMLSLFTILLSAIAIVVSIHTAKLPYKKALLILTGTEVSGMGTGIYVTAINIGNRPTKISMIGLLIGGKQYFTFDQIRSNQIILHVGETTEHHMLLSELRSSLPNGISDEVVYAYARDAEGRVYKKRIGLVRDICNQ